MNVFQKFFIWVALSVTISYVVIINFTETESTKKLTPEFRNRSAMEVKKATQNMDAIRNNRYKGKQVWEFSKETKLSNTGKILIAITVIGSGLIIFSGKNRLNG